MANLWLIGMMGAGKSSVAKALSPLLGMEVVDTDSEIEARMGCSIAEFWGSRGEAAFRDMETARISDLAGRDGLVVAAGGGSVMRPENVVAMRNSGTVVWLEALPDELLVRIEDPASRPPLAQGPPADRIRALLEERKDAYEAAAHWRVATHGKSVDELASEIEARWNS